MAGQTQYAMNAIPLPDDFGLRPLRADDAPDIFTAIDTQREHLGRWLPFVAATHRVEQTREVVAAMLADPANPVFTLRVGDAFAGLIGFVGLVVPHLMRFFVGHDNRWVVPASALAGAAFVVGCDLLARVLFAPYELPVGILLAFIGGPFFIYLILKNKGGGLD